MSIEVATIGIVGRGVLLGMHDDHMAHRFAYLKTDIPVAGCAQPARNREAWRA